MVRANVQLIDALGPLSSFGLEGYLVPGSIDVTQGPIPLGNDYPYGPPQGCDPQMIADVRAAKMVGGTAPDGCFNPTFSIVPPGFVKTSLYERLPRREMENSRYGLRVLGILFRDYTFSLAAYRSFADVPQPRVHYLDRISLGDLVQVPTTVVAELTFVPTADFVRWVPASRTSSTDQLSAFISSHIASRLGRMDCSPPPTLRWP